MIGVRFMGRSRRRGGMWIMGFMGMGWRKSGDQVEKGEREGARIDAREWIVDWIENGMGVLTVRNFGIMTGK